MTDERFKEAMATKGQVGHSILSVKFPCITDTENHKNYFEFKEIVDLLNWYDFTLECVQKCQNMERETHRKEIREYHKRVMGYQERIRELEEMLKLNSVTMSEMES